MIESIQLKFLEFVNRAMDSLKGDERGQTTAEYVAVTAVGVALAVAVIWGVLQSQLTDAVNTIGSNLNSFVTGAFSGS